jgi:hypothetical protein
MFAPAAELVTFSKWHCIPAGRIVLRNATKSQLGEPGDWGAIATCWNGALPLIDGDWCGWQPSSCSQPLPCVPSDRCCRPPLSRASDEAVPRAWRVLQLGEMLQNQVLPYRPELRNQVASAGQIGSNNCTEITCLETLLLCASVSRGAWAWCWALHSPSDNYDSYLGFCIQRGRPEICRRLSSTQSVVCHHTVAAVGSPASRNSYEWQC